MSMVMLERVGDLLLSIRISNLLQVLLAAIPGSRAHSFPPGGPIMSVYAGMCGCVSESEGESVSKKR